MIQCLARTVEVVLMVTTLTPALVLLDSLEQIVKQVITNKLDLSFKCSVLFVYYFLEKQSLCYHHCLLCYWELNLIIWLMKPNEPLKIGLKSYFRYKWLWSSALPEWWSLYWWWQYLHLCLCCWIHWNRLWNK